MKISELIDYRRECPFCNNPLKISFMKSNAMSSISECKLESNILSFKTTTREWPMSPQSHKQNWLTSINLCTNKISVSNLNELSETIDIIPMSAIHKYVSSNKFRLTNYGCSSASCFYYNIDFYLDLRLRTNEVHAFNPIECFELNTNNDIYVVSNILEKGSSTVSVNSFECISIDNIQWTPEQIKSKDIYDRLGFFHLIS